MVYISLCVSVNGCAVQKWPNWLRCHMWEQSCGGLRNHGSNGGRYPLTGSLGTFEGFQPIERHATMLWEYTFILHIYLSIEYSLGNYVMNLSLFLARFIVSRHGELLLFIVLKSRCRLTWRMSRERRRLGQNNWNVDRQSWRRHNFPCPSKLQLSFTVFTASQQILIAMVPVKKWPH